MELKIPEFSLVLIIGASGAGKTSFAAAHFAPTEVISSDFCRAMVCDDENNQHFNDDAFELCRYIVAKRLKNKLLTVVDSTNVQAAHRKDWVELAKEYHCLPVAIVLDLPETVSQARNAQRHNRQFGPHVVRNQKIQLRKELKFLKYEGFKQVYVLKSEEEVNAVSAIIRERLYNDMRDECSPLDIIGDVHGCFSELRLLLEKMGYQINQVEPDGQNFGWKVQPPLGRKAVFLGDLTDRGNDSVSVLKLVMSMVNDKTAYCVCGNHDSKLQRYLKGQAVQLNHGLDKTAEQLSTQTEQFRQTVERFLYGLVSHLVFDGGKLVVAHAGIKENMQGRGSAAVRSFCMYGETTGEIDEFGLVVRYPWAQDYRGKAKVVYGHTPIPEPEWLNRTIDIDTGCVFGGKLTALRYPEEELVSVEALETYCQPARPIDWEQRKKLSLQQQDDGLLDISEVLGKRVVQTQLRANLLIAEENSIAALEVMSRFAVNPRWLIYLPATMSPCATSELPDYLEYPTQGLNYYQKRGIKQLICEEKHMGSRAIVVLCRSEAVALARFGVENEGIGVCYTRTGRAFFNDKDTEQALLQRLRTALDKSNFWEKHQTDWLCLDCELMPWSAKAQSLLKDQYAAVAAAAQSSLSAAQAALEQFATRQAGLAAPLLEKINGKKSAIDRYQQAYRAYCWEVGSLDDYRLAPFHLLATENGLHSDKTHLWHLENIADFCQYDSPFLFQTQHKVVDLDDAQSVQAAVDWWLELTGKGGEGMVIKPAEFIPYQSNELLQPAIKCRGKEYLRIIYGAEYDQPEHLARLKKRNLSRKQSLALREFALGLEALDRFVKKEPLRRIHESVFAILALESEDIDPRL